MKEYIVTVDNDCIDNLFLVWSKDAKEAVNMVYEFLIQRKLEVEKKKIKSRSTSSLHNEFGKTISLIRYKDGTIHNVQEEIEQVIN